MRRETKEHDHSGLPLNTATLYQRWNQVIVSRVTNKTQGFALKSQVKTDKFQVNTDKSQLKSQFNTYKFQV